MARRARAGRDVIVVDTEGYTARIEVPSALAGPVRSALGDLRPRGGAPVPQHTIRVTLEDGTPVIRADGLRWAPGDGQSLCDQVIYVLMRASLDAAGDRLHLHGGYVARDGRGVLVAGYPMAGKSTLVARLVEEGFDYFTDERVGLGRDGSLVAFGKPISLTAGSFGRLSHLDPRRTGAGSATARLWHVPATAVREGSLGTRATPCAVVFLTRADGVTLAMDEVHPAEMARLLLSDSPDAGRFGADAVAVAARFCAALHCRRLVCADVEEALDPVRGLVALDPPAPREVSAISSPALAPGVSGVLVAGRALLCTGAGEIVELPEVPSAWLALLDGTRTLGELVAEVAAENGMPERVVADLADQALAQLRERRLLR